MTDSNGNAYDITLMGITDPAGAIDQFPPVFTIVGLTDRAIQEARERVRASIRNAGGSNSRSVA